MALADVVLLNWQFCEGDVGSQSITWPPIFICDVDEKLVPVMVTNVPPPNGPVAGDTAVTVGGSPATYVYATVALAPSRFVTLTVTAPATWPGIETLILVLLTRVKVTGIGFASPAPWTVT